MKTGSGTRLGKIALLVGVLVVGSGCGAMINGPDQHLTIVTVPPRAKVTVDDRELTTPTDVWLDPTRNYTVKFELKGFQPKERELRSRRDSSVAMANCLCCLCIPNIWEKDDPSHYRLSPEELYVNLDPTGWSPR